MTKLGQKEIKTKWPITSGIEVNEKHEGRQTYLVATEKSIVPKKNKEGL